MKGEGEDLLGNTASAVVIAGKRALKATMIAKGALSQLPQGSMPTAPQAIESSTYLGDFQDKDSVKGHIAEAYKSALLKPLMHSMALACLGQHDAGREHSGKEKHFKIIGIKEKTLGQIADDSDGAVGVFTQRNSAFVALHHALPEVRGTMMHESAHFVMSEVFKNESLPYRQDDADAKSAMEKVIEATRQRILDGRLKQDDPIAETIRMVFGEGEPAAEYPVELAVKVPEIMAEYGRKAGKQWLHANVPELVGFYAYRINPAIKQYLKAHQARDHFFIPPKKVEEEIDVVGEWTPKKRSKHQGKKSGFGEKGTYWQEKLEVVAEELMHKKVDGASHSQQVGKSESASFKARESARPDSPKGRGV